MNSAAPILDHNRQVEADELQQWRACPDRWYGYAVHARADEMWTLANPAGAPRTSLRSRASFYRAYPGVKIMTWLGTTIALGYVTSVYRNNFGATILRVRVVGTNGATYIGAYGPDGGQLIRLRKLPCTSVRPSVR